MEKAAVPSALLTCAAEPAPPAEAAAAVDYAQWLLDLADAGADCRAKLGAVGRLVDPQ